MAFPGLYNEVTHVLNKPTTTIATIVPAAAVLTHVLHLLIHLVQYLRTYCICTRRFYTCCCAVRTALLTDVPYIIYTYISAKKGNAAEQTCYIYLLMMHVRILKKRNYQLLKVRTYCTYCCSY